MPLSQADYLGIIDAVQPLQPGPNYNPKVASEPDAALALYLGQLAAETDLGKALTLIADKKRRYLAGAAKAAAMANRRALYSDAFENEFVLEEPDLLKIRVHAAKAQLRLAISRITDTELVATSKLEAILLKGPDAAPPPGVDAPEPPKELQRNPDHFATAIVRSQPDPDFVSNEVIALLNKNATAFGDGHALIDDVFMHELQQLAFEKAFRARVFTLRVDEPDQLAALQAVAKKPDVGYADAINQHIQVLGLAPALVELASDNNHVLIARLRSFAQRCLISRHIETKVAKKDAEIIDHLRGAVNHDAVLPSGVFQAFGLDNGDIVLELEKGFLRKTAAYHLLMQAIIPAADTIPSAQQVMRLLCIANATSSMTHETSATRKAQLLSLHEAGSGVENPLSLTGGKTREFIAALSPENPEHAGHIKEIYDRARANFVRRALCSAAFLDADNVARGGVCQNALQDNNVRALHDADALILVEKAGAFLNAYMHDKNAVKSLLLADPKRLSLSQVFGDARWLTPNTEAQISAAITKIQLGGQTQVDAEIQYLSAENPRGIDAMDAASGPAEEGDPAKLTEVGFKEAFLIYSDALDHLTGQDGLRLLEAGQLDEDHKQFITTNAERASRMLEKMIAQQQIFLHPHSGAEEQRRTQERLNALSQRKDVMDTLVAYANSRDANSAFSANVLEYKAFAAAYDRSCHVDVVNSMVSGTGASHAARTDSRTGAVINAAPMHFTDDETFTAGMRQMIETLEPDITFDAEKHAKVDKKDGANTQVFTTELKDGTKVQQFLEKNSNPSLPDSVRWLSKRCLSSLGDTVNKLSELEKQSELLKAQFMDIARMMRHAGDNLANNFVIDITKNIQPQTPEARAACKAAFAAVFPESNHVVEGGVSVPSRFGSRPTWQRHSGSCASMFGALCRSGVDLADKQGDDRARRIGIV